jgi:hypothetical protein
MTQPVGQPVINVASLHDRLVKVEADVATLKTHSTTSKGNTMSSTTSSIEQDVPAIIGGVEGALTVGADVQSAVASQTGTLAKIEEGLSEFLSVAPSVITAINPAAGAFSVGVATAMQSLLGLLKDFHFGTVVPAANASSNSTTPHS